MEKDNLYDSDYYLWIQKTVSVLNDLKLHMSPNDPLDISNLINEIAGIGFYQKRELRLKIIDFLTELIKYDIQTSHRTEIWFFSIMNKSHAIKELIEESPSLKKVADESILDCYERANQKAIVETGFPDSYFKKELKFSFDEIINNPKNYIHDNNY